MKAIKEINVMKSNCINNRWEEARGPEFQSINPATKETIWAGNEYTPEEVNEAIASARFALNSWAKTTVAERQNHLQVFAQTLQHKKQELLELISQEVGKPRWEARLEVEAMVGKIAISIEAYNTRCREFFGGNAITRFHPHGVVAVFGPYNFPGHLPNGHIVPALLAGNTVIFKPSPLTPAVSQKMVEIWLDAGLPPGVLNLVQGGAEIGKYLAQHTEINGVFFTGSAQTGLAIRKMLVSEPGKILALEMGGNNPLIVHQIADHLAAACLTIESAYITSGQRCTCARRLIIPKGSEGDSFLDILIEHINKIRIGNPTQTPEPFMGAVVSSEVAEKLLEEQAFLANRGGNVICELKQLEEGTGIVSPGLIDVTGIDHREDKEIFGPLLQVIRVNDFSEAIEEANKTRYGLSAGLLSENEVNYKRFYREVKAGIINWNSSITGASSSAPFGGIGLSGNHRPSAFLAADYCAYPIASIEKDALMMPSNILPGLSF